ncbi:MAG: phosphoribosylformylglycinamidine synthase [Eubacterium sp.]|nr:phosphoribosylformylglycinamidine synthase [Eubacterium sp.]
MVYRIYVEKKSNFAHEANSLYSELVDILQIKSVESVRIVNRYDVEGCDKEIFTGAINTVFSEPQVDDTYGELSFDNGEHIFAVEFLPGQFDQRASSAAECIQLISKGERPLVRSAKVYIIKGNLNDGELERIKSYVINPVEARQASLDKFDTIKTKYEIPTEVEIVDGFINLDRNELMDFIRSNGLAMDIADLEMCRKYFESERRNPTITEIKVIDTYWSDHCRHTTFNTVIDSIKFEDGDAETTYFDYLDTRKELNITKPVTLMDMGTLAAKYLKSKGLLSKLDESDEINACTVKIDVEIEGRTEKWLLLFKNETHNHPTEIEPFGGAATCVGGAIRDPLSGRSYVYSAMRLTGAADPLQAIEKTIKGKLPQRKIVTTAAAGYSSYGNQIGLATGMVDELYHPGYAAKRMEIGAVIAAAPAENVRREKPLPGDLVVLIGGKTGRDGCGGATGSSKSHTEQSLESCGAEVQKGNAPEERKLQRLFRNPEASKLIKRCNDFGAGGVSVAIGELADGLDINLNKVPKKYDGLDGTELAISESQERMAVVVAKEDAKRFCELANHENLEANIVAEVTERPYLKIRWNDKTIVEISREFLDTNGAEKRIDITVPPQKKIKFEHADNFNEAYRNLVGDLNICSKRGLSERFDSTIGAGSVLMPFGGKRQRTPVQAMVNLISTEKGSSKTCSLMSWGFNPIISSASPYKGAYLAVVESVSKLVAAGASIDETYLSFQEYFEKPGHDGSRWGKPLAALLGAFAAQKNLGIAAIGGKDSMSGTFEDLDVPPTLVSFAVTTESTNNIISPEFKGAGNKLFLLSPCCGYNDLPNGESLKNIYAQVNGLMRSSKLLSAYTPCSGGIAEAVFKMCIGNGLGFKYADDFTLEQMFSYKYGSFLLELNADAEIPENAILVGETKASAEITWKNETLSLCELEKIYEDKLEPVFNCNIKPQKQNLRTFTYEAKEKLSVNINKAIPKVLIPVFPGTNCEYDTAKAFDEAGASSEIFIINNLSSSHVSKSVEEFAAKIKESQVIFIPGGFSGGDEPDGSGKFITAFFRNTEIKDAVTDLLDNKGGLMAGICNGFQALIKLGLVPYGKICDIDESCPTLTFNEIGRHQSKLIRTRVSSNKSPWMSETKPGEIYTVPISHGEGRFIASDNLINELAANGQILTQYVDLEGKVSGDIQFNPNGSYQSIEGITSPDGRVLGKMAHSERIGRDLYKNVSGNFDMGMFRSAVKYFR